MSRRSPESLTKPTTQGKNERFHQTLFRYLDKQPLADTLAELQAQVDAFDHIYNTERPHQGLPGRLTPQTAWEATARVDAPRPKPGPPSFEQPARHKQPTPILADMPAGTTVKRLTSAGTFMLDRVHYMAGGQHGNQHVLIVTDDARSPSPTWTASSSSSTPDPHPA